MGRGGRRLCVRSPLLADGHLFPYDHTSLSPCRGQYWNGSPIANWPSSSVSSLPFSWSPSLWEPFSVRMRMTSALLIRSIDRVLSPPQLPLPPMRNSSSLSSASPMTRNSCRSHDTGSSHRFRQKIASQFSTPVTCKQSFPSLTIVVTHS